MPSSLAIPISNAFLLKGLHNFVPKTAPSISADAIIAAGALDVETLTSSPVLLHGLREAWARSVGWVNIFLTAVICISVPTALGMRWLNIKKVSQEREAAKKTQAERLVHDRALQDDQLEKRTTLALE
jgi:hypothetical protein